MYAGNAHRDSGIKSSVSSPKINSTAPTMSQGAPVYAVYGGAWSDTFTLMNQFKYPTSSELNILEGKYTIPGILWQNYLINGKLWSEEPIPDIQDENIVSMVYPGSAAWNGEVTTGTGERKPIIGGYKING